MQDGLCFQCGAQINDDDDKAGRDPSFGGADRDLIPTRYDCDDDHDDSGNTFSDSEIFEYTKKILKISKEDLAKWNPRNGFLAKMRQLIKESDEKNYSTGGNWWERQPVWN